jgi:hypothetical protein
MSESKSIRVQSVVFPEHPLSFNEWAEKMNVSTMYSEEPKPTGHYYPMKPLNLEPDPFRVRLYNFIKELLS